MTAFNIFALLLFIVSCASESTFSPLRPPALPLAVKSPYLSTWLQAGSDGGNGGYLAGEWPTFWAGAVTGWTGMIRVDGEAHTWMGAPEQNEIYTNQTSYEYTSTRSIFKMSVANSVEMKITFLSPLNPEDLKRSSLPYSYMEVEVKSTDGDSHEVQLYTDISAEWVAGDTSSIAEWDYGTTSSIAYHKVWRQKQLEFSEESDQASWGHWYYATDDNDDLTHQSGSDDDVRDQFKKHGKLSNTKDTNFRSIDDDYPVFGLAVDLGKVSSSTVSKVFQLSLHQDNCVQFESANGVEAVPCLWKSYFDDDKSAIGYFYKDYNTAKDTAISFDNQISSDSKKAGGSDYLSLTSLAARQAFATIEWTNTPENPWVFMKELSSSGNIQTVDVIFPFHPIAVYMSPSILKYLLDPLIINQEAGFWPHDYAMHDLGSLFPNATGHDDGNAEKMPLEECGDMIIMSLAYAQRANDNDWLAKHYEILKQWNNYLIKDSLLPRNQISTDDFAGSLANQTNLAIKGIIGIEAMSQIAARTGHKEDAKNFTQISHDYVKKWMDYGIAETSKDFSKPHTTLAYNFNDTFSLLYNLFADRELDLSLVPQSVYDQQSKFYPSVFNEYGAPLDTRHGYTKVDWEIFCASIASTSTRDQFTSVLAKWLDQTPTNFAFPDLYRTDNGDFPDALTFIARPVVGAMFAFLALDHASLKGTQESLSSHLAANPSWFLSIALALCWTAVFYMRTRH